MTKLAPPEPAPLTPQEIRAIRESLDLTQAEAGEMIGGGPRAFTKYESGAVTPAASVVKLLRLLDEDPSALAKLTGVKAPPIAVRHPAPFEITGAHVATLSPALFAELLRKLLVAEALSFGLPLTDIHVASSITSADGGEDGRITWDGGPERTKFLPARRNLFQLKAGPMGPAGASKDVLERDGNPKSRIADILREGGVYLMLCARAYPKNRIDERADAIRVALRSARLNFRDEQVLFLDADQVATWTNQHPAAATWVLELTQPGLAGPFRSWTHAMGREEHDSSPFVPDPRLAEVGPRLRATLSVPQGVVRVFGASGVGKSRLVLEALAPAEPEELAEHDFSGVTLYTVEPEQGALPIRSAVQHLVEAQVRAVVIVDRCPQELHNELEALVQRKGSRLSLATVDDEVPGSELRPTEIVINPAGSGVIEAMAHQALPTARSEDLRLLVKVASGNPRMARLVTRAWTQSLPLAEATGQALVDSILLGRASDDRDTIKRAAALLAVFGLIGVKGDADQLPQIALLGRNLTTDDLRAAITFLVGRGLIQTRGRSVILQPRPMALRLARQQWKTWSDAQREQVLTGEVPAPLKAMAARQLTLLNTTSVAAEVVAHVARRGGPLDGVDKLAQDGNADVLVALAEIDAAAVARLIAGIFETADLEKLPSDVRRGLVRALERVSFLEETFEEGALLMLRLACLETEKWANNATGQFAGLFPIILGDTAAGPEARLQVLDEALASTDPAQRRVVAKALLQGVKTSLFSRGVGPELHGARPALQPWRPQTNKDAPDYIKACAERLALVAAGDDEAAAEARAGLGHELVGLINNGLVDVAEAAIQTVLVHHPYWPQALEGLGHWAAHSSGGADPLKQARIEAMMLELQPRDLADRAKAIVTEMPWDFPNTKEKLPYEQRGHAQVAAVEAFAQEVLSRPGAFETLLPALTHGRQRMAFAFGRAIASALADPIEGLVLVVQALAKGNEPPDYDLMTGFLVTIAQTDPQFVETFKAQAATSALAPALPLICWRLNITESDIALVVDALKSKQLPPWNLMQWTMGGVLAELPPTAVAPLFDTMLDLGGEAFSVGLDVMGMYGHDRMERFEALRPQLLKLAEGASKRRNARSQMDSHHFRELLGWLLEKGEADPDARAAARILARRLGAGPEDERLVEGLLPLLLSKFAQTAWPLIGQIILDGGAPSWRIQYALRHTPPADDDSPVILGLPEDTLFGWCHAHPDVGPVFVAQIIPMLVTREPAPGEARLHPLMARLLEEFGDRPEVLEAVAGNMSNFFWTGSLASYYALYLEPFELLKTHRHAKLRRWAKDMVQRLQKAIEGAKNDDDEREAGWEI
jgi:transcriptional regulator with XRE-family HTH domain